MAKSENTPDPIFARLLAVLLLATAGVAAQSLNPSSDDLRLEQALTQYREGGHDEALRALADFSRGQVMEAPKTFSRTLTGQLMLKAGADAIPTRFALGLMFVEAGLEAFERDDEDLSGAFLSMAHVWLTRHLSSLPDISNDLSVPPALGLDLCVISVGPLIGRLQLDAARKAWQLCPPQVQALSHARVLRGSIEEIAVSDRVDFEAHYYVPGARYSTGGVLEGLPPADRWVLGGATRHRHELAARAERLRIWREAEGWYSRALDAAPDNAMARLRLAVARWQLEERREADQGFPWLLDPGQRVAPDVRYLAHLFSARIAEVAGGPALERAAAHYERAIRIMPRNQAAYLGLSRLRFDSDRAEAARLIRAAVSGAPDELVDPWFNYDMQFAFEAAALRERWYRAVQRAPANGEGEPR